MWLRAAFLARTVDWTTSSAVLLKGNEGRSRPLTPKCSRNILQMNQLKNGMTSPNFQCSTTSTDSKILPCLCHIRSRLCVPRTRSSRSTPTTSHTCYVSNHSYCLASCLQVHRSESSYPIDTRRTDATTLSLDFEGHINPAPSSTYISLLPTLSALERSHSAELRTGPPRSDPCRRSGLPTKEGSILDTGDQREK